MKLSRFGVLGGHPERASLLGRKTIAALEAAGVRLVEWIEGGEEPPLPWDLHQPAALNLVPAKPGAELDFILQLDETEPPRELFERARYGIWRLTPASPAPLAFWDVFDGQHHIEIRLDRLTTDPARRIPLDRRWLKIDRLSYEKTLEELIGEMSSMPVDAAAGNLESPGEPVAFAPRLTQTPSTFDLLRLRIKLLRRAMQYHLFGLFFSEAWDVGVVSDDITCFMETGYIPKVQWLPSPSARHFLADPFLARTESGWLLMVEDYDYTTNRGKIVQEFSADGTFTGKMQDAIVEPCHMSYPFLLQYDGKMYCIPETNEKGGVWAWLWDADKSAWTNPREILPGVACLDPTPVFYENRWWLFYTDKTDGVDSKLRICYADTPWGPWKVHARNPAKVDIRSSRPGGTPFVHRGTLYRPAQDSSKHYGWRVVLMQVTRLSPEEFEEEIVRVVDSDRLGVSGLHTISGAADRTVIDVKRWRFTPWRTPRILRYKLQRFART